jgi:hypothetical protein
MTKRTFEVNESMIFALGQIYAYGTEHEDDDEKCESWLELMRKLRTACVEGGYTLELVEEEREMIEGALSYAVGFYDIFDYPEKHSVLDACKSVDGEGDITSTAIEYFDKLRKQWVKLYGEESALSIDNRTVVEDYLE